MRVTREHGLLDASLLKHVQAIFCTSGSSVTLVWFCPSFKGEIQRDGSRYIRSMSWREICELAYGIIMQTESTQNFSTLLLCKKIKVITSATYSRKKDFNPYLQPVSLSNSIQYAKTIGLLGQTTKFLAEVMCQV